MPDRAVLRTAKKDGEIAALCDPDAKWSPRLKEDAIRDIETDAHQYYVQWTYGTTWVRVVEGPRGKYLRTDKDSAPRNNLEDLPDC